MLRADLGSCGYTGFYAYNELTFQIRHVVVMATGEATFALANYPRELTLRPSEETTVSMALFVPASGACEVSSSSVGPFMVEEGKVTVTFAPENDDMRLCVKYTGESFFEPQRFVMTVGVVSVPSFAAAWTVYEPTRCT